MPIIAKHPESSLAPCPEGLHQAVCVDVVDLGIQQTPWGDKHQVRLMWQVEEDNPDTGKRFQIRQKYSLSLHEKANLRKHLEAWRGRKFTDTELQGFDLEKLIGANCQVQVAHDIGDDATIYANLQAVVPPQKNVAKLVPREYVREKDRAKVQGNGSKVGKKTDDDVPF